MKRGRTKQIGLALAMLAMVGTRPTLAQEGGTEPVSGEVPAGVAEYVQLGAEVEGVTNGHILELHDGQYRLATTPYSTSLFGVVRQRPAIVVSTVGREGAEPVVQSGIGQVLVNGSNGRIEVGNFVTSSNEPGVGMLANQSGFVIGTALDSMPEGVEGPVSIPVSIDVKYVVPDPTSENLTPRSFAKQIQSVLTAGVRAASAEPNTFLRYLAATLIMLAAMGFGFLVFGRSATNGVISIGRNPLARKSVFFMVFVNVGMALGLVAGGLVLGFFILAV